MPCFDMLINLEHYIEAEDRRDLGESLDDHGVDWDGDMRTYKLKTGTGVTVQPQLPLKSKGGKMDMEVTVAYLEGLEKFWVDGNYGVKLPDEVHRTITFLKQVIDKRKKQKGK